MLENYPDVLNTSDICLILRISRKTAYKLLQSNVITCRKIGRNYKISKEAIIKYLSASNIEQ